MSGLLDTIGNVVSNAAPAVISSGIDAVTGIPGSGAVISNAVMGGGGGGGTYTAPTGSTPPFNPGMSPTTDPLTLAFNALNGALNQSTTTGGGSIASIGQGITTSQITSGIASTLFSAGADSTTANAAATAAAAAGYTPDSVQAMVNAAGGNVSQVTSLLGQLPTVAQGGTFDIGSIGQSLMNFINSSSGKALVSAGINALNTHYAANAATTAGQMTAAGATQAASVLSQGAKTAADIQSNAATTAANTLSSAITQGAQTQAEWLGRASASGQDVITRGAQQAAAGVTQGAQTASQAAIDAAAGRAAGITQSGATLAGGFQQAAQQQVAGQEQAIGTYQDTLNKQSANLQPYTMAGTAALDTIMQGLQPGGQFNRPFSMADMANVMPAYQFTLQEAQRAQENAAAAGGTQLSSGNVAALGKQAAGIASTYEQQAFNQWLAQNNLTLGALQNMVATGQVSTSQLNQALSSAGVNIATAQQQIGIDLGAGTMGAAQATAQAQRDAAAALAAGTQTAGQITGSGQAQAGQITGQGTTQGGLWVANAQQQTGQILGGAQTAAGQAQAQGQIGAGQAQATGTTGAANATAAGIVGAAAGGAAGLTNAANIISSGVSNIANTLGGITPTVKQPQSVSSTGTPITNPAPLTLQ